MINSEGFLIGIRLKKGYFPICSGIFYRTKKLLKIFFRCSFIGTNVKIEARLKKKNIFPSDVLVFPSDVLELTIF